MQELLPCPFCGSKDVGGSQGIVYCYECGVETSKHPDTELAGLSWNNRIKFSTVEGMQLVSEKAISFLSEKHPAVYNKFYEVINKE